MTSIVIIKIVINIDRGGGGEEGGCVETKVNLEKKKKKMKNKK